MMKRSIGILLIGMIIALISQPAAAQKYGYIKKDELIKSMPNYDSANVQIEKLRKEFENQLASMQSELSSKTTALDNDKTISDFVRKSKEDELKNLNVRIQLFQLKANQQLNNKNNELVQPLIDQADNAIKEVAKEQGFVFVMDGNLLLYTDEKKCTNMMPLVKAKLNLK
jgi:outer membrane protein